MEITTVGLDIAKRVFQLHGVDAAGKAVLRRTPPLSERIMHLLEHSAPSAAPPLPHRPAPSLRCHRLGAIRTNTIARLDNIPHHQRQLAASVASQSSTSRDRRPVKSP